MNLDTVASQLPSLTLKELEYYLQICDKEIEARSRSIWKIYCLGNAYMRKRRLERIRNQIDVEIQRRSLDTQ